LRSQVGPPPIIDEVIMRIKTIGLISALALGLLAGPLPAEAQQAGKVPRISVLRSSGSPGGLSRSWKAFLRELSDRGHIETQNILIEYRYGKGRLDRKPDLVNELVQQKVDLLVVTNQVAIRAAKKATKTIPIVMVSSLDPVAAGYVDSLARSGGNITGLTHRKRDLNAKSVELLKEVLPGMSRLAVLGIRMAPDRLLPSRNVKSPPERLN